MNITINAHTFNTENTYRAMEISSRMGWQPEFNNNGDLILTIPDEDDLLASFIFGQFC
jgi:hypothetical protein